MTSAHNITNKVISLLNSKDQQAVFTARQFALAKMPLSEAVELYLYANEGQSQNLDKFPMMREIYNKLPQRLLLKCSRKTLKSTLLSNIIALNMLRYNHYNMLYVGPQETSVKYFSAHYISSRFESPPIKKILNGFEKDDVFEKILADTHSSVILRFVKDDATRCRGPATDHNVYDEVQDIDYKVLPIIKETMALSPIKREYFAGTPYTTDNTISRLWRNSNQLEWGTKCTKCNHWNFLIEENDPLRMILPHGISCSKCSSIINTQNGQWVSSNSDPNTQFVGYHLAQPMLPFYNQSKKGWAEIYEKVTGDQYNKAQIFNEVFGLPYDIGSKWISEGELKKICTLGPLNELIEKGKSKYQFYTVGVDWGVNMQTARTVMCLCGVRGDGIIEVCYLKVFKDFDYDAQIDEIAGYINGFNAFAAADGGPDPIRAIGLATKTSPQRVQIAMYPPNPPFVQFYKVPPGSIDWRQNRWNLHRTDTITFLGNLIKKQRILFPRWEDSAEALQDLLNVYIETKEGLWKQEMFYRHGEHTPDDFTHALNYAVCQAHVVLGNPLLSGPSSTSGDGT